jgi:hypothetical protein
VHPSLRRLLALLVTSFLAVSLLASCGDDDDETTDPAAQTAPQEQSDRELASELARLLKNKDMKGLDEFLSPAFQLQRADGSYLKKKEYLENPSQVDEFEVFEVSGTRYGNTRIIRYVSRVSAIVNGKRTGDDPSPRLATFVWNGERWQLAAFANYVAFESADQ